MYGITSFFIRIGILLLRMLRRVSKIVPRRINSNNNLLVVSRGYTNWPFLKEEHRMIADMCKNFADTELAPVAAATDKLHQFPTEQVKKLGELGMMGMGVSPDFGGAGMDNMCYAIAMEEISRVCASTGVIMSANNSLYCGPVNGYGNDQQKSKYLTPW